MDVNKDIENIEKDEGHPSPEQELPACGFSYGALCPHCKQGILDYNGMLNLQCPVCGLESGHGFT